METKRWLVECLISLAITIEETLNQIQGRSSIDCLFVQLVDKATDGGTLTPGSNAADADRNGLWEPATWVGTKTFEIAYLATEV